MPRPLSSINTFFSVRTPSAPAKDPVIAAVLNPKAVSTHSPNPADDDENTLGNALERTAILQQFRQRPNDFSIREKFQAYGEILQTVQEAQAKGQIPSIEEEKRLINKHFPGAWEGFKKQLPANLDDPGGWISFENFQTVDSKGPEARGADAIFPPFKMAKKQYPKAQFIYVVDKPGKHRTGLILQFVNLTGKPLDEEQVWKALNSSEQEHIRRRLQGLGNHERGHEIALEACPGVKIQEWNEYAEIIITDDTLKKPWAMEDFGRAVSDVTFNQQASVVEDQEFKVWNSFLDQMNQFDQQLQKAYAQSPQAAINFCQATISDLQQLAGETLPTFIKEYEGFAYLAEHVVMSAMVPLVLLDSFPKHAATLSPEDIECAKQYTELMQSYRQSADVTRFKLRLVQDCLVEVTRILQSLQGGLRPTSVALPFAIRNRVQTLRNPVAALKNIYSGSPPPRVAGNVN